MKRSPAAPPREVVLDGFVLRRYQRHDAPALAVAVGESLEHLRPWMPWIALEPTTLEQREELLAAVGPRLGQGHAVQLWDV